MATEGRRDLTKPSHKAAGTIALEAVARFLAGVADGDGSGETAGTCLTAHIADMTASKLPASAQESWHHIARLLRTPAAQPIPEKATAAMRSWPQTRVDELIEHVRDLHAILEKVENDRLEDEIRDNIRRHYL